ncbi:MAG: DUF503 domain-containing protein [Planctomycetota bacterium]|jgi:uncharacterized protein YlxP (DUF503 family)
MSTTLGLLHLRLHVVQATSLKDKRRVIKGFKDRIASRFNVSIAEVDGLDNHRTGVLAIAMVSNDRKYVESALGKIVNAAQSHRDMVLIEKDIQWL